MNKITITKENIARIEGQLKKFFRDRKFIGWHTWTGGMRKRIGYLVPIDCENGTEFYDVRRQYDQFEVIRGNDSIIIKYYDTHSRYDYHCYDDDDGDGSECCTMLEYGDQIAFLGNRIIVKTKSPIPKHKYLYECFQVDDDSIKIEEMPVHHIRLGLR